jgi:3-oxoacyl-[acyl-carrier-protein] synthase III
MSTILPPGAPLARPETDSKASRRLRSVGILGMGTDVPERVLSNADLEKMVETSDEWIRERTGMVERRIARDDQATSDLATAAGRRALDSAGMAPEDLQLIIVATATADTTFPPTACYVQHGLGAVNAAGFDVTVACSSFISALMTAEALVAAGTFENALVIGADKLSSIVDYEDRNTCVLFGDGAGAVLLGADRGHGQIIDHVSGVDGSRTDVIIRKAGGSRRPATAETVAAKEHFMHMEGRKVFKFAVQVVTNSVEKILAKNGYTIGDLDLLIPHQANLRIIESATARLGIDPARVAVNIEKYGNTSSASIPLALGEAVESGQLKEGQLVCLVAFGGGLSWGATLLRW